MDKYQAFEELMEKLYATATLLTKNTHPKQYGTEDSLFLYEVHTVKMIYENPGLSLSELAEMSYRTKGAMSLMIEKLVGKGLVCKRKAEGDQRRYEIELTDKGNIVGVFHEAYDSEKYGDIVDMMPQSVADSIEQTNNLLAFMLDYMKSLDKRKQLH